MSYLNKPGKKDIIHKKSINVNTKTSVIMNIYNEFNIDTKMRVNQQIIKKFLDM